MRNRGSLYLKPLVLVLCLLVLSGCGVWKKYTANSQIKKVDKKVEEAKAAEANKYVSDVFKEATDALASARSLVGQKQYDNAIQKAQESESKLTLAINKVASAKANLQGKIKEIDEIHEKVKNYITKAEEGGALDIAPDTLQEAKNGLEQIPKQLNEARRLAEQKVENYETVKANANAVLAIAQKAYNATLREQAAVITPNMKELAATAEEIDLITYLPEIYNQILAEMDKYRLAMEEENYEEAVNTANTLMPEFEKAIVSGKQLRASDHINQATLAIENAKEMGGLTYAPEYLQNAMENVTEAKVKLNEGAYDESYSLAVQSYENTQLCLSELEKLAEELLVEVKDAIEITKEEGAEQYAPELFTQGKTTYGEASLTLTQGNIRESLDLGSKAKKLIDDALNKTKMLIAKELIGVCESIIKTAIDQGASDYTREQLAETDNYLNKAREMFRQKEYMKVHEPALEARKLGLTMMEMLNARARSELDAARSSYGKAVVAEAETYAPDKLQKADELIVEGESAFSKEEIKKSLTLAKEAQKVAWDAEQQSYRLRTDAKQSDARKAIEVAETAGARVHSPKFFNQSLTALQNSEGLYGEEKYYDALQASQQSLDLAQYSRLRIIKDAEKFSQSALAAEAETYAGDVIKESLMELSKAKTLMESKNYSESNELAQIALDKALTAEKISWRLRSDDLVKQNDELVNKLMNNKALEKVEASYAESIRVLALAKADYEVESFKSSYEKLVEAQTKLQSTWEELRQVGKASIAAMNRKINDMGFLVLDQFGTQEKTLLIDYIPKAQLLLDKNELGPLFDLETEFTVQMSASTDKLKTHNMEVMIADIDSMITKHETSRLTLFIPEQTADLRSQLSAQKDRIGELGQYEDILNNLDSIKNEVMGMSAVGERAIDNRITGLQRKLNQALQNEADRLVPKDYENALIAYKEVPVDISDVESYQDLYNKIVHAEELADKASQFAQTRIEEEAYKELLKSYIIDTNALLSGFSGVTDQGYRFFLVSKPSEQVNIYRELQRELPASAFYKRAVLLNDKINQVNPPKTLTSLHNLGLDTFKELVSTADNFQKFGMYNRYDESTRAGFIKTAYDHLATLKENLQLLDQILEGKKIESSKNNFVKWMGSISKS